MATCEAGHATAEQNTAVASALDSLVLMDAINVGIVSPAAFAVAPFSEFLALPMAFQHSFRK